MAKDDYFVLVYKILAYLYTVLKEGRSPDAKMNLTGPILWKTCKRRGILQA